MARLKPLSAGLMKAIGTKNIRYPTESEPSSSAFRKSIVRSFEEMIETLDGEDFHEVCQLVWNPQDHKIIKKGVHTRITTELYMGLLEKYLRNLYDIQHL